VDEDELPPQAAIARTTPMISNKAIDGLLSRIDFVLLVAGLILRFQLRS